MELGRLTMVTMRSMKGKCHHDDVDDDDNRNVNDDTKSDSGAVADLHDKHALNLAFETSAIGKGYLPSKSGATTPSTTEE